MSSPIRPEPVKSKHEVLEVEISEDFGSRVYRIKGSPEQVNDVVERIMDANQPFAQKHFGAIAGIVFILIALALGFSFQNPTALQRQLILVTLSLGGGAFSLEFANKIRANLTLGQKLVISAGGAAAVFVILYFFTPAGPG
jgi:hypothetical protein